jgi:phosphatidylserine decarboxylase
MRFPLAKDGYPYLGIGLIVSIGTGFLGWSVVAGAAWIFTIFVACFFRDPERHAPEDPFVVVAPADGKVDLVRSDDSGTTHISIFLSIFDVHINRSPVAGKVVETTYQAGKFNMANWPEKSADNERNTLRILPKCDTDVGEPEVIVCQIAGAIARRIICWAKPGDVLRAGERFGLIKFGSRVDLILPRTARPVVSTGDRVRGGVDIVARWEGADGA